MAKKRITLTVALAVFNEGANLARCLASVSDIADQIVVVDGGSRDTTVDIAKRFGAEVTITNNPAIFHINKQKALNLSRGEWILQLDADEVVDGRLKEEIKRTIRDSGEVAGYYIPRRNYFLGDWLRKGGQYPDYVIRLFRRGKGIFPQKSVHEQIEISGSVGNLKNPLDHYSYTSIAQYWGKSASYIRLTAGKLRTQRGTGSTFLAITYVIIKPIITFFALFVRHKGFMDGWRGFLFALFSAMHFPKAYWLYKKLN